jgi:hypothetical protein
MVTVNQALTVLGVYFGALFAFGLFWTKREAAARRRRQKDDRGYGEGSPASEERSRENGHYAAYADSQPEIAHLH